MDTWICFLMFASIMYKKISKTKIDKIFVTNLMKNPPSSLYFNLSQFRSYKNFVYGFGRRSRGTTFAWSTKSGRLYTFWFLRLVILRTQASVDGS